MSKKYTVILSGEAEQDIDSVFAWFVSEGAQKAGTWWIHYLFEAIAKLEQFPMRCPVVPSRVYHEMRQLIFGKKRGQYLIHFIIVNKTVHILHIRHSARDRTNI